MKNPFRVDKDSQRSGLIFSYKQEHEEVKI